MDSSYIKKSKKGEAFKPAPLVIYGAPEGIRTPGLRIRSPLLYPAELQAQYSELVWIT